MQSNISIQAGLARQGWAA